MNVETIENQKVKAILSFSIPAIIAMVLASFITIVDGFFIGNYVGEEGIAAVNLGLPIIYLYLAVGLMLSVGGVALSGMAYGEGNVKQCRSIFNQTLVTLVIIVGFLSVGIGAGLHTILEILDTDLKVAAYFKAYYGIMLFQLPLMIINASLGMFIRGEGNPQYFMKVNILNVVLNILLDYVFVVWFDLGVEGVAVASILATIVPLICLVYFFIAKAKTYRFEKLTFSKKVLKSTLLNGSSEFIGELSLAIGMFAYNLVIMKYIGVEGVTAFAVVGYIAYVFSMIIIGFGQGVSPLMSFTYGAKAYKLTIDLRKITNKFVVASGSILFLLVVCTATWYSRLFVSNQVIQEMIDFGAKLFAISFLFSGVNTITSFYFTSIGRAFESAVISAARGLVILLVCIFTLPQVLGMVGIWLVAPITEGLTFIISIWFIYKESTNLKVLLAEVN